MAYFGLWLAIGALIMFWGLWERSPEEPLGPLLLALGIAAFGWPIGIVLAWIIVVKEAVRYYWSKK